MICWRFSPFVLLSGKIEKVIWKSQKKVEAKKPGMDSRIYRTVYYFTALYYDGELWSLDIRGDFLLLSNIHDFTKE